jgi:hypothetical protein
MEKSVPEAVSNQKMNRRALLLGAVFLVGGSAALLRLARNPGSADGGNGPVLTADQYALLEQVANVIIPDTDTPGAIAAGVPQFMRTMLAEWASPDTHRQIVGALDTFERQSWAKYGAAFLELPGARRLEVVRMVDEASIARQDVGYDKFKGLVLLGYYLSEIGATQELRYELVPGAWRACLPLTEVGRASAVG